MARLGKTDGVVAFLAGVASGHRATCLRVHGPTVGQGPLWSEHLNDARHKLRAGSGLQSGEPGSGIEESNKMIRTPVDGVRERRIGVRRQERRR